MALFMVLSTTASLGAQPAGMTGDPEAQALLAWFRGLPSGAKPILQEGCDGAVSGTVAGPVGFGPGAGAKGDAADQALRFGEDRSPEACVRYGPFIPRRGRLMLDLRVDALPGDHHFMTLFSVGTAGNTCMLARLRLDRRVTARIITPVETIALLSDPVDLGCWHRVELWFAPEGALLCVDGAIHDYSTDYATVYAPERPNAFYLGDQPWWDAGGRKGVFYPLDSFVGRLDNLEVLLLGKDLPRGPTR